MALAVALAQRTSRKRGRAFFEDGDGCALLPGVAHGMRPTLRMVRGASNVLLCDDDRYQIEILVLGLTKLGHSITIARSCADAFAYACRDDFDALVAAPSLRDGTALMLPRALGIRKPKLIVLVTRLGERLARTVAHRVGFHAQLTKMVDAERLDRLLRSSLEERVKSVSLEAWTSPR